MGRESPATAPAQLCCLVLSPSWLCSDFLCSIGGRLSGEEAAEKLGSLFHANTLMTKELILEVDLAQTYRAALLNDLVLEYEFGGAVHVFGLVDNDSTYSSILSEVRGDALVVLPGRQSLPGRPLQPLIRQRAADGRVLRPCSETGPPQHLLHGQGVVSRPELGFPQVPGLWAKGKGAQRLQPQLDFASSVAAAALERLEEVSVTATTAGFQAYLNAHHALAGPMVTSPLEPIRQLLLPGILALPLRLLPSKEFLRSGFWWPTGADPEDFLQLDKALSSTVPTSVEDPCWNESFRQIAARLKELLKPTEPEVTLSASSFSLREEYRVQVEGAKASPEALLQKPKGCTLWSGPYRQLRRAAGLPDQPGKAKDPARKGTAPAQSRGQPTARRPRRRGRDVSEEEEEELDNDEDWSDPEDAPEDEDEEGEAAARTRTAAGQGAYQEASSEEHRNVGPSWAQFKHGGGAAKTRREPQDSDYVPDNCFDADGEPVATKTVLQTFSAFLSAADAAVAEQLEARTLPSLGPLLCVERNELFQHLLGLLFTVQVLQLHALARLLRVLEEEAEDAAEGGPGRAAAPRAVVLFQVLACDVLLASLSETGLVRVPGAARRAFAMSETATAAGFYEAQLETGSAVGALAHLTHLWCCSDEADAEESLLLPCEELWRGTACVDVTRGFQLHPYFCSRKVPGALEDAAAASSALLWLQEQKHFTSSVAAAYRKQVWEIYRTRYCVRGNETFAMHEQDSLTSRCLLDGLRGGRAGAGAGTTPATWFAMFGDGDVLFSAAAGAPELRTGRWTPKNLPPRFALQRRLLLRMWLTQLGLDLVVHTFSAAAESGRHRVLAAVLGAEQHAWPDAADLWPFSSAFWRQVVASPENATLRPCFKFVRRRGAAASFGDSLAHFIFHRLAQRGTFGRRPSFQQWLQLREVFFCGPAQSAEQALSSLVQSILEETLGPEGLAMQAFNQGTANRSLFLQGGALYSTNEADYEEPVAEEEPVSYTHLTMPTIYSV